MCQTPRWHRRLAAVLVSAAHPSEGFRRRASPAFPYNPRFDPETIVPQNPTHTPSFEQFQAMASVPPAAGQGHAIPIYRTLLADHLTPVTAFERLTQASTGPNKGHAFLLESVVGGERIARYSF